jgi:hypothetical protein
LFIAVFYAEGKGGATLYDSKWGIIEKQLDEKSYQQIRSGEGIPYSTTIPIRAKGQIAGIVIYDEISDRMGSRSIKLRN